MVGNWLRFPVTPCRFLTYFGVNKAHVNFSKTKHCNRPFVVFEKFTRVYLEQIALEIMLLPILI